MSDLSYPFQNFSIKVIKFKHEPTNELGGNVASCLKPIKRNRAQETDVILLQRISSLSPIDIMATSFMVYRNSWNVTLCDKLEALHRLPILLSVIRF